MDILLSQNQLSWLMENYSVHAMNSDFNTTYPMHLIVLRRMNGSSGDVIIKTCDTGAGFGGFRDGKIAKLYWADKVTTAQIESAR